MATNEQPANEQNQAIDPAQLGADQAPETTARDDSRDMSTIMANAEAGQTEVGNAPASGGHAQQGSGFDQQRRQGAVGSDDSSSDVGAGQGMGRSGSDGDEDRGYDQSGYRGGLGASGGREDLSDRHFDADQNPYTGGYGGTSPARPEADQTKNIGLNSSKPTAAPGTSADDNPAGIGAEKV
jgi:hypothetical protein